MKKLNALILATALLLSLAACGPAKKIPDSTVIVTAGAWSNDSVGTWYDVTQPERNMGNEIDAVSLRVGKNEVAALRMSFPADIKELESARLWLHMKEGQAAEFLTSKPIYKVWDSGNTPYADLLMDEEYQLAVQQEADGWVSMDITTYARGWVSESAPNYGIALQAQQGSSTVIFDSGAAEDKSVWPKMDLTYVPYLEDKIETPQGKFKFEPLGEYEGNCLGYALRDKNMILADDLSIDYDELNKIYRERENDWDCAWQLVDHIAWQTEAYVTAHKDALQISSFRRIATYDSSIDPEKEYRIVLRVGYRVWDDKADFGGKGNFDFHWRVQMRDGRWAQKFPLEPPGYLPCLPAGEGPAKYPWDSAWQWGNWKFTDYYDGPTIYFAVTKDGDGFTMHKGEADVL